MSSAKRALLSAARAGMEISWRYAWASYLMLAILRRGFPLAEAAAALVASALLSHWLARRSWRLYQRMLLQLAAFGVFAVLVVHRIWNEGSSLLRLAEAAPPWYVLALVLSCLFLFWRGGRTLVKEPEDYVQFDRGVGLFLLLLLVKLIASRTAGALVTGDRAGEFLVPAFFIFSLAAMGLVGDRENVQRSFRAGFRGVGVVLAVSALLVLFASGVTLLFYSRLSEVADSIQVLLRGVARPAGRILTTILLFLFSPKNLRNINAAPMEFQSDASAIPAPVEGAGQTLLTRILGVGLIGVIGLLALGMLAVLAVYLVRLLRKRIDGAGPRQIATPWLLRLLALLVRLPRRIWRGIVGSLKGADRVVPVYRGLLRWGSRSGLPPLPSETPAEYGARLRRRFPVLSEEIAAIVDAFNREVYGEISLDRGDLSRILSARRRLLSPRHWPTRLRVVFSQ